MRGGEFLIHFSFSTDVPFLNLVLFLKGNLRLLRIQFKPSNFSSTHTWLKPRLTPTVCILGDRSTDYQSDSPPTQTNTPGGRLRQLGVAAVSPRRVPTLKTRPQCLNIADRPPESRRPLAPASNRPSCQSTTVGSTGEPCILQCELFLLFGIRKSMWKTYEKFSRS